jgi:mannosyltransferase OCH1-like enzyme
VNSDSKVLKTLDELLKADRAVVSYECMGHTAKRMYRKSCNLQTSWILAPAHDEFLWNVIWQVVRNVYAFHTKAARFRALLQTSANVVADIAGSTCFTFVAKTMIDKVIVVDDNFIARFDTTLVQKKETKPTRLYLTDLPIHLVFVQSCKPKRISETQHKIPAIIHQTHETKWVTPAMANAMQQIRDHAPNCEYCYYDAGERRSFIKQHYPNALDAYDALIPGSYQTDLFRAVAVYTKGGTYFDSGFIPLNNSNLFQNTLKQNDVIVFPIDVACDGICTGMFASVPKHEYLKKIIDHIIDNVRERKIFANEAWGSLKITGPVAFAEALRSNLVFPLQEGHYANGLRLMSHTHPGASIGRIHSKGEVLYATRYNTYDDDRLIINNGMPHYGVLWEKGLVYKA